jgi:hypothetical protein
VGAAVYGLLGGVWMFMLGRVAPQSAGSVVLWGGYAVYGVWGGITLWRRTGLPFATAAVFLATAIALLMALAIAGWPFPQRPPGWLTPVTALLLLLPILLVVESRVHPGQWAQWKAYAEDKNAWDILLGRHVPYLRDTHSVDGSSSVPRR